MVGRKRVPAKKRPVVKRRNTAIRNNLAKQKRAERIINKLKGINEQIEFIGGAKTAKADTEYAILAQKRAKLRLELQKHFPEVNILTILKEHGIESALERVLKKSAEQSTQSEKKERRPSFSVAKTVFLKKSELNEKTYGRLRKVYLNNHPGEVSYVKREAFANKLARTANIPFNQVMQFVNFAQRYPGMFKKRE